MCAELCIPFGNSLLAPPFVLPGFLSLAGYFQQPQGETVTDASLLCPRARRACGVGGAQHLAVAMETAAGRWRSFEFDYPRMRCAEMITAPPHQWNPMCPMWLSLRYGNVV